MRRPSRLPQTLALLLPLLAGLALAQDAPEPAPADPATLPYRVEIAPTGDSRLDAALGAASQLLSLQDRAPTTAGGILGRARADRERLQGALQSEGYWAGTARITLAGRDLDDPGLVDLLDRAPPSPLPVAVTATQGPAYTIAAIDLRATRPEEQPALDDAAATPFGIAPGDPARAAPILAAEATLRDRLLAAGHPLATLAGREATVDHDRRTMRLAWTYAPGPFARFAPPAVDGAERVDPTFLAARAGRLTGQPFSPEALERQRRDLMGLGVFAAVRARAAERLDQAGALPTTFTVTERARRAIGIGLAYETNYGPTIRASWEHRNLFGAAERLRIEAEIARLGQKGSLDQSTYRIGATYRDPWVWGGRWLGPDWTLLASAFGLRERLDAYDRDAVTFSALLERRIGERAAVNFGPVLDFGSIGPPGGALTPYQIIGLQFGGRFDTTDSLLDPARGVRVSGTLTPSWSIRDAAPFAPLRVTASTYWDVLGDRRSILALRGSFGSLLGAERAEIPRHQRFYAGGGGSVRGFDYQSIGPRDLRGRPSGGASLLEASVEWRQRVWGDIGAVAFVDAGAVGTGSLPDTSNLRVGAGLGLRYLTPIGPIRADVAVPVVRQQGSSGYGLYVGIGQAF